MCNKTLYVVNICIVAYISCIMPASAQKSIKIQFDSSKEVSGKKFAIQDITPGIPANWDGYNFVVLELKASTPQRFHVGFTTETGYNELRVMSYCANGWNKLAIPLRFYRDLPGAAHDLAATYNQPRYTGWVNLGGKRGPLRGIDSIGIRMQAPINNPVIELRSISLSAEDPGDQYLGDQPVVDEFGQWNLGEFESKVKSAEQLQKEWAAEEVEVVSTKAYDYAKFGGYLPGQRKATGFFRTEKINGKWWFVDPEGYQFLSVGVDCVSPGGGGNARDLDKRDHIYKALPPTGIGSNPRRPNSASFGTWNLYRRYGDSYPEKSRELVIKRMDKWGLNTICNWSSMEVMALNRKAFMLQLRGVGIENGIMGLPDVYATDFTAKVDASIKEFVTPFRENPWLIGYFSSNEPSWTGQEERLCGMLLSGGDRPLKNQLLEFLNGKDTPEKRRQFVVETFRIFLQTVNKSLKTHDPNHLNLGIRFGHNPGKEILAVCKDVFDVFSFNCYDLAPKKEFMDQIMEGTGLPMIIGEYHFGTVDRGMAQSLWQVNSQKERGVAFSYYTEQAYSHPGLIGTAWFQWCDQDLTGRFDGENYNCGLVDVTDRPYPWMVEAISRTAQKLYGIHNGSTPPTNQKPVKAKGHGGIPDLWEK
jgi:hypothetical protein